MNLSFKAPHLSKIIFAVGIAAVLAIVVLSPGPWKQDSGITLAPSEAELESPTADLSINQQPAEGSSELEARMIKGMAQSVGAAYQAFLPDYLQRKETYELQTSRILEWHDSLGRFTPEQLMPYQDYTIETLIDLGRQCDLNALAVLAVKEAVDWELLKQVHYTSAVCGSTSVLFYLAPGGYIKEGQTPEVRAQQRAKVLGDLAWYEVGAMRGDRTRISIGIDTLNEYKISLTEAEKQAITAKAKQIYAQLEAQRTAWGFPPFNNYVPPSADKIATTLLYKQDNPTGWGKQYYDYVYEGSPPW